jgi:hypothetical protein
MPQVGQYGGAGESRTRDTQFRKLLLYPSELQPHKAILPQLVAFVSGRLVLLFSRSDDRFIASFLAEDDVLPWSGQCQDFDPELSRLQTVGSLKPLKAAVFVEFENIERGDHLA